MLFIWVPVVVNNFTLQEGNDNIGQVLRGSPSQSRATPSHGCPEAKYCCQQGIGIVTSQCPFHPHCVNTMTSVKTFGSSKFLKLPEQVW